MNATVVLTALGAVVLCAVVLYFLRRPGNGVVVTPGSVSEISLERYRAFSSLRSQADLKFLSAQPGCTEDIRRKLVRAHTEVAGLYLREMRADFQTLCRAARAIALASPVDRSDLVAAVQKEEFRFYYRLAGVRLRMALPAGWVSTPAFSGLAGSLERIQNAMRAGTAAQFSD